MSHNMADNGKGVLELIIMHGRLAPTALSNLQMTNSKVGHFVLGSSRAQKVRMPAQSDRQRAAEATVWMASNGSLLTELAVVPIQECSMVATALQVATATSFAHAAADAAKERESVTAAMVAQASARKAVRAVRAAAAAVAEPAVAEQLAMANCLAQVATEEAVRARALAPDRTDVMRDFVAAKKVAPCHGPLQQLAKQLYPSSGLQLVTFRGHYAPGIHLILKQLKQCTGLKSLQLTEGANSFTLLSDADKRAAAEEVSCMSSLQQLKLTPRFTQMAAFSLAGFTGLTELDLFYREVSQLPMSLRTLKLCGAEQPPSNMRQLQQLEKLHLQNCAWEAFLPELVHLKQLTCVKFQWAQMLGDDYSDSDSSDENSSDEDDQAFALQVGHALADLTTLKEIHFIQVDDEISRKEAQQLWIGSGQQLPVVSLRLHDLKFGEGATSVVAAMHHLTQLSFNSCSLVSSELATIVAALPSLIDLAITDFDVISDLLRHGAFVLLCGAIAQSRSLQKLTLVTRVTLAQCHMYKVETESVVLGAVEGIANLRAATRLQSLDLTSNWGVCNDVVVQLAASLTQLTKLVLDQNPGLDKAVVLPKVQQLSSLQVFAWDGLLEVDKAELLLHIPGLVFDCDDLGFV